MKWEGGRESENVEDRRGMSRARVVGGGGILTLVIIAAAYFLGLDPRQAQQIAQQIDRGAAKFEQVGPPPNDRIKKFASTVLGFTEEVWHEQFRQYGMSYQKPGMVLFSDEVDSEGCGVAPSAVGPFYCPASKKVFLDPTFFDDLERQLGGSKAEFSQAYVIAHEVGHHVQNLLGYSRLADQARRQGKVEGNQASVRLELQADYLAGVWAHHGQKKFNFIEPGDVEAALTTAKAIGDDRIQKKSQGWTSPESYTHGTSEQRLRWFRAGLQTGDASKQKLDAFFKMPYDDL